MTDERIDIEVTDKVDASVETKLRGIASAAREGYNPLIKLKQALSALDANSVTKLANASAKMSNALARELNGQARLMNAVARSTGAEERAALAKQRLATEAERTATATARLASETAKTTLAQTRALDASERLAGRQSRETAEAIKGAEAQRKLAEATRLADSAKRLGVQSTIDRSTGVVRSDPSSARESAAVFEENARAVNELEQRLNALRSSVDPLGRQMASLNAEIREADQLFLRGAIDASEHAKSLAILEGRVESLTAAQRVNNTVQGRGVQSSKAMTQAGLNLSRQFADIGVTAAMGMNPLMILIQQGPQVADAFAMAKTQGLGFSAVMRGLTASVAPFLVPLLAIGAVVGTVAAGFGLMHRELSKGYPKDITDGLNLTDEQLKKVKSRTVTFGDTVMATFTVAGRYIMNGPVGKALDWLGDKTTEVLDWIVKKWKWGAEIQGAVMIAAYRTITQQWRQFPRVFGDFVVSGVNSAIEAIEGLVNKASDGLNLLIRAYNANPLNLVKLPEIGKADLGRLRNQYAGAGAEAAQSFAANFNQARGEVRAGLEAFGDAVGDEALRRARARALKEAGEANKAGGGAGGGREGAAGFDRAKELAKVTGELDRQIGSMRMLADAREIQNQLDGIAQTFSENNAALTAAETASIRGKLQALQDFKATQSEMDRIYSEVTGPLRTYNGAIQASTLLLVNGTISGRQYAEQLRKSTETYRLATDPLYALNQSLSDQIDLLGQYGPALERATQLQQAEIALRAQGKSLYDATTGALTAEGAALAGRIALLQQGTYVQQELNALLSDTSANDMFLANLSNMYAEIERMRQANTISETKAAQMHAKLNARYYEVRLQGASTFFGNLATLTQSGNKKLAMIGKAAAVAQATIDGILAVQKALASAPPPFNYIMAASVGIAAAANVANILSQNTQGFKSGGWTGNGSVNAIAGVTHGKEFVVKAGPAAANRSILEAMNAGRDPTAYVPTVAPSAPPANVKAIGRGGEGMSIVIENYGSSQITAERVGPDEVRIIAREVAEERINKKVPALLGAEMSNPNSRGRKAMAAHTTVQPKR